MYSTPKSPKPVKRCAVCGEDFPPRYAGQKCCGKTCAKIQADRTRSARRAAARTYVCEYCGETYEAKKPDRRHFCCRKHAHLAQSDQYECQHCGRIVTGKKNLIGGKYCSDACRDKVLSIPCEICGTLFVPHSKASRICDDKECHKEVARRAAFAAAKARHDKQVKPRQCRECGEMFTPEYGSKLRVFCTEECRSKYGRRVSKAKRKARLRGAKVADRIDPLMVLKRDKWRCHICGCKTPKRLRGTIEGNAPEIDHVIPIALGGTHTYDNVKCICRQCNGKKGASLAGQVSLFATQGYA